MTSTHRARWAAIGAATAVTLGAVGINATTNVGATTSTGQRAIYNPIAPCRLMDTRAAAPVGDRSTPLGRDDTATVAARGANGNCTTDDLPTNAVALQLNVTAVGATARTFLSITPDGTRDTSSLNPVPGAPPTPNAVTVALDTNGGFAIFNRFGQVDVIVDVAGYYTDHDHDDRYYTKAESDDRYEAVSPDSAIVQIGLGRTEGTEWRFSEFGVWSRGTGASECVSIPVDVPAGRSISDVDLRYVSEAGPADFSLFVIAVDAASGTDRTESDLVKRLLVNELVAPQTQAEEVGSIIVADDRDDTIQGPPARPTESMPSVGTANLVLCSDDEVTLIGIVIDF
ncbi:MAG: hypothetical protein AAGG08_06720 [Actinomycetota bacterium]